MFRSIRARELDPGGRLGARGGCASTSSSCRAPTLGWPEKELGSWAEADALSNCTATYSDLRPAPRSTIAAAFSPDGKRLASDYHEWLKQSDNAWQPPRPAAAALSLQQSD